MYVGLDIGPPSTTCVMPATDTRRTWPTFGQTSADCVPENQVGKV